MSISFFENVTTNFVIPFVENERVIFASNCFNLLCATEMIFVSLVNFERMISQCNNLIATQTDQAHKERYSQLKKRIQKEFLSHILQHTVAAVLLAASTANLFTGSTVMGTVGFMIYSKLKWTNELTEIGGIKQPSYSVILTGLGVLLSKEVGKSFCKLLIKKVIHVTKVIFHGIASFAKKSGKILLKTIKAPFKFLLKTGKAAVKLISKIAHSVLKILGSLLKHPKLALGVLIGSIVVILGIKYFSSLQGAMNNLTLLAKGILFGLQTIGSVIVQVALKLFSTLSYIAQHSVEPLCSLIKGTFRVLTTLVGFVPSVLIQILRTIAVVVKSIFTGIVGVVA